MLDLMGEDDLAILLKAIADPARLRILRLLPQTDSCSDVYNVSELADEIGLTQPTVSHHLAVLREAGLVNSRRMCRDVYYWLEPAALRKLLDHVGCIIDSAAIGGRPA